MVEFHRDGNQGRRFMTTGEVIDFVARFHARASEDTRRSSGMCIFPRVSQVTPGMLRSAAAEMTKSQYSTGIDADRRCSLAVDGPLPMIRAKAALPPNASMRSGTVDGESVITPSFYRNSVDRVNRTPVDGLCDPVGMGEVGDRLKQARIKARYRSAAAAAKKLGMPTSTYASHENGQTEPSAADIRRYAKVFKASAVWILFKLGPMEARNIVPLMGFIGAGGDIDPEFEQVPPEGLEDIELPFPVSDDAIAFRVRGASMRPKYGPGDVVICSNVACDPDQMIGAEVAVRTADNKRYLKVIRPGRKRGLYRLESFNDDDIEDVRIAWIGEILFIVPERRSARSATRLAG